MQGFQDWNITRRAWLLGVAVCVSPLSALAAAPKEVDLTSGVEPGDVAKVDAVLEVGGVLKFKNKDDVKTLPTTVAARFAYEEKSLSIEGERSAVRVYRKAEADVSVNQKPSSSALRTDRNILLARAGEGAPGSLVRLRLTMRRNGSASARNSSSSA